MRLVPLIHRLPESTKLNWNDAISEIPSAEVELIETTATVCTTMTPFENCDIAKECSDDNGNGGGGSSSDESGAIANTAACETITSANKEMKTERHKKLSNTKQAIRRGRPLRQTVCSVEPAESGHTNEMAAPETIAQEANLPYSGLTSGKQY